MTGVDAFLKCTGSKFGLARKCVHWAWHDTKDKSNDAADLGSVYHELVSTGAPRKKRDDHLTWLAQELWFNQPFELESPTLLHEVAFRVPESKGLAEVLDVLDRNYPMEEDLFATIDLVEPGEWVGDLKTGEIEDYHRDQVELAAWAFGLRKCRLYYVYDACGVVRHQRFDWTLTPESAEAISRDVARLRDELSTHNQENKPPIRGGEHCESQWCALRKLCPGSPAFRASFEDLSE